MIKYIYYTTVILALFNNAVSSVAGVDINRNQEMNTDAIKTYLRKYHYMGETNPDPAFQRARHSPEEELRMGLLTYQRLWGLPETGDLNEATVNMIRIPRCGMPDIFTVDDIRPLDSVGSVDYEDGVPRNIRHAKRPTLHMRSKRYAIFSARKFEKEVLTYKITSYPRDGPSIDIVNDVIDKAFQAWQLASILRFTKVQPHQFADIILSFLDDNHGDEEGRSDMDEIAHALLPYSKHSPNGSQIHFDNGRAWIIYGQNGRTDNSGGYDLYYIAIHEIGHALGMQHETIRFDSVMHPYYKPPSNRPVELSADDKNGINALYPRGKNEIQVNRFAMAVDPTMNEFCERGTVDAITSDIENGVSYLYVFQGESYVRMIDGVIEMGYPRLIRADWPGLPNNIDSAMNQDQFTDKHENQTLVFFKDNLEYLYRGNQQVQMKEYPSNFKQRTAMFKYGMTGKILPIHESMYLHYLGSRAKWRDLGEFIPPMRDINISAAHSINSSTVLFFSDRSFYAVDMSRPISLLGGYPKDIATDFFKCGSESIMMANVVTVHTNENNGENKTNIPTASLWLVFASLIVILLYLRYSEIKY